MTLTVEMQAMLCARPDTCWYFFRGKTPDGASQVCKGKMAWQPAARETLTLTGDYVVYKGERHFQFADARINIPEDPAAALHYCIERANGCGPALEAQIWKEYGAEWPTEYFRLPNIREAQRTALADQLTLYRATLEKASVISWLEDRGCTSTMAAAAYEKWHTGAPGVVQSDCYRLAELPFFAWNTVDRLVRPNFGISDEDPRRIDAAVKHAATVCSEDGSTAFPVQAHQTAAAGLLPGISAEVIAQRTQIAINEGALKLTQRGAEQFLSSAAAYDIESGIARFLDAATAAAPAEIDIEDERLAAGEKFTPDATQLAAVRFAIQNRFAVINGGAGVGKTSVVRMIVRGLRKTTKLNVLLCAPTGKAAARLKEATGMEATTIHAALCAQGDGRFMFGDLDHHAVIVDEASMVDAALMHEITKRRPARLILVGDQAQLTPVGAGQPFHDIIAGYPDSVRTLTHCYRNREAVYAAAMKIREGQPPCLHEKTENEKWIIAPAVEPDGAEHQICGWARQGILNFSSDIVLCPRNGRRLEGGEFEPATVNSLNQKLLVIDRDRRGGDTGKKWQPGDRVINGKNRPDAHVWNGTTGEVLCADDDGSVYIRLDEPVTTDEGKQITQVKLNKEQAADLNYAYALTIHKSQGSQYRRVVMLALSRDCFQLDRAMIYTGVTRTRETCVVIGGLEALVRGINNLREKTTVLQILCSNKNEE